MKYILTYKFSQDNHELFFAAARSSGGCNNPTAKQFMAIYKRLLIRHDVSTSGNATALDNTKILEVVNNSKESKCTDIVEISMIRSYELMPPQPADDDISYAPNPASITEYSKAAIGNIAGYVVTMVKKLIHCPRCTEALTKQDGQCDPTFLLLIQYKTNGVLIEASPNVFMVCQSTEACI